MPINIFRSLRLRSFNNIKENLNIKDGPDQGYHYKSNFHKAPIENHFANQVLFEGVEKIFSRPLIILAFTNRSGSNLLAEFLRQTSLVAGLGEYLNSETVIKKSIQNNISSFPEYLRHLVLKLSHEGQFFGVKASAEQLKFLSDWNIESMFSRTIVVHIHRDDILNQAISHWIARQTGQWTSLQNKKSIPIEFNGSKIMKIVSDITEENNAIHFHCARNKINYLSVSYQEVMADPKAVVKRIFISEQIDLLDWHPAKPKISKQANITNDEMLNKLFLYLDSENCAFHCDENLSSF